MTAADELRLEGMALAMRQKGMDLQTILQVSDLSPQDWQPHRQ